MKGHTSPDKSLTPVLSRSLCLILAKFFSLQTDSGEGDET